MTSRDIICMRHKRYNTGGCRGDGVPAARSVAFPQTFLDRLGLSQSNRN